MRADSADVIVAIGMGMTTWGMVSDPQKELQIEADTRLKGFDHLPGHCSKVWVLPEKVNSMSTRALPC